MLTTLMFLMSTAYANYTKTIDPLTDEVKSLAIIMTTDKSYSNRGAAIVRCTSNKTESLLEFIVDWSDFINSDGPTMVMYRIDSLPALTEGWSLSTDGTASFAPDSKAILELITVSKASSFVARTDDYRGTPITRQFTISEQDRLDLAKVASDCKKL